MKVSNTLPNVAKTISIPAVEAFSYKLDWTNFYKPVLMSELPVAVLTHSVLSLQHNRGSPYVPS